MKKILILISLISVLIGTAYAAEDSNGKVYIQGEFLDGDILKISVWAENISSPTLGIAFHLKYEGDNLGFLKYLPGEFLEKGGDPFYLVKNDEIKNKVIFGETLRRDDSFPVGSGKITDFYFQIINEEQFSFKFDNSVLSTLETIRQDLDNVLFEDFFINREDGNSILVDQSSVLDNLKPKNTNIKIYYKLIFLSFLLLFLAIKIIKNYIWKKRHRTSVNFN